MADLPGNSNWFQRIGSGLKKLAHNAAMIMTPGAVPAQIHTEGNLLVQEKREAMQIEQMKLSWVQHRENLELKERLEQDRQAGMERLAQINHQRNLEIQQISQQHQKELEQYREKVQLAIQEKSFDFQRWKLQEEKELQLTIINLRHELDLEIAKYNRGTALNNIREQRRLANSPINLVSDDLLESPYSNGDMPLRILLSPPELNSESMQKSLGFKIENHLAEELRAFLAQNYSFNGEQRQTQLLDGAWVSKKFRGGAGVQALYSQLRAVPTIILESEADSNYLSFRVAYWRGDGSEPLQQSILSNFPYQDFLYESARERAREWQKTRKQLADMGESPEEIKMLGGNNEFNLFVLQKEQKLIEGGIDVRELDIKKQYKLNDKDFQKLHQYLITFHCLSVGLMADMHYLSREKNLIPLLPSLLSKLFENIPDSQELQKKILDWLIPTYDEVYQKLEEVMASWIPELRMQFAVALSDLRDKSYAKQQGEESVRTWLRTREIKEYSRKLLKTVVTKKDKFYFESLQKFIENFEDESKSLTLMKRLLEDWILLNELDVVYDSPEINVDDADTKESKSDLLGEEFSFEVVTVNASGNIVNKEIKTNRQQVFELDDEIKLEMVHIPAGTFMMGAPEYEQASQNDEKPQHKVTLKAFWIAKYPITQAQYQVVIGNNPSNFQDDSSPVENVAWNDAVDFCQKISTKLKETFQLPSEAQWEYACRAGTKTPFHFGETITENLANYDANSTYLHESSGNKRGKTTPVGIFSPNTFGLYDMHGNVWEWCEDDYHDNYEGALTDGSAWLSSNSSKKVIRGGSWCIYPPYCRSASRDYYSRSYRLLNIGFRVVCVAPRTT
jgi:formylglycine-generating enzyme required for sulfatase activity